MDLSKINVDAPKRFKAQESTLVVTSCLPFCLPLYVENFSPRHKDLLRKDVVMRKKDMCILILCEILLYDVACQEKVQLKSKRDFNIEKNWQMLFPIIQYSKTSVEIY